MPPQTTSAGSVDAAMKEDVILAAMGYDPVTIDALIAQTGHDAAFVMSRLTELELAGSIASLPGGKYQRLG